MRNNKLKIEKITKGLIREISLDMPSDEFTNKIMNKVFLEARQKPVSYQPVISKRSWQIIIVSMCIFVCFILFVTESNNKFFEEFPVTIDINPYLEAITTFINNLFGNIQIPPSIFIGLIPIVALVIADKFLRKIIWHNYTGN